MKRQKLLRVLAAWLLVAAECGAQNGVIRVIPPHGPSLARPYLPPTVPPAQFRNMGRLRALVRAGKLYLTVQDAIAAAIENNLDLEVARYDPLLADWALRRSQGGGALRGVQSASSQVSSVASGQGVTGSIASSGLNTGGGSNSGASGGNAVIQQVGPVAPNLDPVLSNSTSFSHLTYLSPNTVVSGSSALAQTIHNYNTRLEQGYLAGGSYFVQQLDTYLDEATPLDSPNPSVAPRLYLYWQQNLLRGAGVGVNSRFIRVAKADATASLETFRSQLQDLVTNVLNDYWDLVADNDTLKAREDALQIAQKFYDDTNHEVQIGVLARIELPRAAAELASRRQDLIIAQAAVREQEIIFKDLLTREPDPVVEAAPIVPLDSIEVPPTDNLPPLRRLVARAMAMRPDVAVAKIRQETAQVSAVGTANGVLPTAQAFAETYDAGVAGTGRVVEGQPPNPYFEGGLGTAFAQVFRHNFPNEYIGIQASGSIHNHVAQADYGIEQLQLEQSALTNRRDMNAIVVSISNQMTAVRQARARYAAAVDARTLQQELLTGEQRQFSFGTATISDVITAQRALVAAQSAEIGALASYAHARVSLDQVLGETLEVNHVSVGQALAAR
jgi:outer membrane protein